MRDNEKLEKNPCISVWKNLKINRVFVREDCLPTKINNNRSKIQGPQKIGFLKN